MATRVFVVFALLGAVSCGGGTTAPATTGAVGSSATSPSTSPVRSSSARVGSVADVTPARTTPLGRVRHATIRLAGSPDWMVAVAGLVWVKGDAGDVVAIDPRTNRVVRHVHVDTKSEQYCQGIGAGGGAVWSCSGSDVVRVDPLRSKVVASIAVGKIFDQGRLLLAAGRIWVLAGEGDRLVGIDATSGHVGQPVPLGTHCSELGPGVDSLLVLCRLSNVVLRFDPAAGTIGGRIPLAAPTFGVATATDAWIGYEGGLARIELPSGRMIARFPRLDPGLLGDLRLDGSRLWVHTNDGALLGIDTTANAVATAIRPPRPLTGGSLLVAAGSLWAASSDENILYRLQTG